MTNRDLSGQSAGLLIKASEAARLLGVTPRTLARWSESGTLPPPVRVGPGQRRHYHQHDIDALLNAAVAND
jgi:DNA-binding transcriptional MerR regulator